MKSWKRIFLIILSMLVVASISTFISITVYKNKILSENEQEKINNAEKNTANNENNIVETEIIINGEKNKIKMEASTIETGEQDGNLVYIKEKINITINEKKVEDIITYTWTDKDNYEYIFPEVVKICDSLNKSEYMLFNVSSDRPTGNPVHTFVIYDSNENKIADISDQGATLFFFIDNEYTIPAHIINKDSIQIVRKRSDETFEGADIYLYTIENGILKSKIINSYTSDEVGGAGAI